MREFENGQHASRLEHAVKFAKSSAVIRQIAKTERNGNGIERIIRKRQFQRVGFYELRRTAACGGLFVCRNQHGMAKICAYDLRCAAVRQVKQHVSGSTAEIEYAGVLAFEHCPQAIPQRLAPAAVNVKRQQMVQQVVTRRNLGEHAPYPSGRFPFV